MRFPLIGEKWTLRDLAGLALSTAAGEETTNKERPDAEFFAQFFCRAGDFLFLGGNAEEKEEFSRHPHSNSGGPAVCTGPDFPVAVRKSTKCVSSVGTLSAISPPCRMSSPAFARISMIG
jgi:hypothetical protein